MGMVTTTFAQTCKLTLDDILTIDSQESFERVLIENNFQRANLEELGWKKEAEELSKKDILFLVYSFEGDIKHSIYPSRIMAIGYFPSKSEIDSGDIFSLMFGIIKPEEEYSFYNMVFSEVKRKCAFEEVRHTDDGRSAAFYNCPNATFKGKIGFSIDDDSGLIRIGFSIDDDSGLKRIKPAEPKKKLDALLGGVGNTDGKVDGGEGNDNQAGDKGKITGDPNASGYYGNSGSGSGGNYILLNRKALTMPKPTYDCNEEGKVYVSISVDKSGNVITAQSGVTGTTNSSACLLQRAKEAALKAKFNSDTDAPAKQVGAIIYDFKDDNSKVTGDSNASGYYGNGGSGSGGNYRLGNRKALTMPKPTYDCNEEGKVLVSISVDNSGNVISAQPGVKGTTNSANCLLERAKEAALKTKFNSDSNAPSKQVGTIIYNFSLSK